MLRKFFTVAVGIGIGLLLVNVDLFKGFKLNSSYGVENKTIKTTPSITKSDFGRTPEGHIAELYTLTNSNGVVAKITNFGGILTELHIPDSQGELADVVLGFDTLEDYFEANRNFYFGAVVGRVANRIQDARFTLNSQKYNLAANLSPHHIHGGERGFDRVVWQGETIENSQEQALKLTYFSPDGEEGYPGNLTVTATYTLTDDDRLKLEMTATTDKDTPVNLVNHSYWNLAGHNGEKIYGQYLTINGDKYTPTDSQGIPTGAIASVEGTPYDFRQPREIGEGIKNLQKTLQEDYSGGYDLNYVLNKGSEQLKLAATVYESKSGRVMEVSTNQPGMQFFSGNIGELKTLGKGDVVYQSHQGLCLETQHFPDSVNQPNFPSIIVRPGETYRHETVYKFYAKQNDLSTILSPNAQLEKVAGDFKFTEGPVWHPEGFLLFSDIPANTIYKWQPDKEIEIFRQPSGNANGNILDLEQRLITGEHGNRRVSRTEKDGQIVTLASHYQGKQLNSPNDLAVKSDGSIYFTDPPYGIKPKQEELGFYGVYRLTSDGELTLLVDDFVRPNGIVFSPDETKLYVNDSKKGHIRVFDLKPDGTLGEGKLFAEMKPPGADGASDGMKVDIKGNIYSTGVGGVWIFSPDGDILGIIETPEPPANIAWGGEDYKTLYITARTSLYRILLQIPGI